MPLVGYLTWSNQPHVSDDFVRHESVLVDQICPDPIGGRISIARVYAEERDLKASSPS